MLSMLDLEVDLHMLCKLSDVDLDTYYTFA